MSIKLDVLESRYRQHGVTYEAAALLGDAKAMNKIFAKWIAIGPKLRGAGEDGQSVLRRLMGDPSDAVATWAATDSLPFAEKEALKVLDAIAKKGGPIPFDAMMTAEQWRAGKLNIG